MATTTSCGPAASDSLEVAGRVGFVARGAVYLVLAGLAVSVAGQGDAKQDADTLGAIAAVGSQPYGQVLLWALAAGLASYALWRGAQAVTGRTDEEDDGLGARLAVGLRAVAYLALAGAAVRAALEGASGSGAEKQASWTATVLDWPAGTTLVAIAGTVVVVLGLAEILSGITGRFMEKLRTGQLSEASERAVRVVGGIGHAGRGVAWALIGAFVVRAALDHDPSKSRGLDGALAEVVTRSYGPPVLVALAVGLFAFGLSSLAEARWRRIRA